MCLSEHRAEAFGLFRCDGYLFNFIENEVDGVTAVFELLIEFVFMMSDPVL